ncbi:MAG: methylenetetrahydrofolate reductase C-terminal domain-containing protein [Candidatus Thermoplasmatota archaeon]
MLVVQVKGKEEILEASLRAPKILIIKCIGCREVYFPDSEVTDFIKELKNSTEIIDTLAVDYLCNLEFTKQRIEKYKEKINDSKSLLVFSCGIGVQTLSSVLEHKQIIAGCDTIYIKGFQGLTPNNRNCAACNECWLNYTLGICPVTSCRKSLLNGPCGGAKNGKCEVDKEQDCAWNKIYERLDKFRKVENIIDKINIRDYLKVLKR